MIEESTSDLIQTAIEPSVIERWGLSQVRSFGGRVNHQWLVTRGQEYFVLRRYDSAHSDIEYELNVLSRLRDLEWPVPEVIERPIACGGAQWCLFSFLEGTAKERAGYTAQRSLGRLLAKLHESTSSLIDLGQRGGFARSDAIIADPALIAAVKSYERIRPDIGRLMRWHIDKACKCLDELGLDDADQVVLHSDFTPWNLLFKGDVLSGVLDFESTHLNFRVADFALSWRGTYDPVILGYDDIYALSELDWQLLVPIFWAWLFLGVKDEIEEIMNGQRACHGFEWQVTHLIRRSALFRDMAEPYRG